MNLAELIDDIKKNPDFDRVGMILCHNGIVRGTARDGRKVSGLKITVDHKKLQRIIDKSKAKPGIVDVRVQIAENKKLEIGDDVMFLVVAGNVRENVISILHDTLNSIKSEVTKKEQFFI